MMNTIKQLLIPKIEMWLGLFLLLLLLATQSAFAAEIKVSVDRNPVSLDESFQITFTATESPDDDPSFGPLQQDFSILSQSSGSSSSWVNGKSSKTVQWKLSVMAKQAGDLVIPAVKFGKDVSQSITIRVTDKTANKAVSNDEELFIEVEAIPENPYVQSQVFYTLRLYTRVDISQARLNEPELSDAVIERLGEDSNYNTQVNGVNYSVTERKYAFFPQKSGKLTIKPLLLTAEVLTGSRPGFNGFFNSQTSKTKNVESKAITLDVKPVPASFTGKHWLSSEQLVLKQDWSGDIQQMKVGEPLTRTLTLIAKGTTVGQLPELNTTNTNDQLKAYPDQPVLQEQKKVDGLLAFREEKIALIPSKAGSYTLPAIEIPWFNTQSQKMEIAKIPETTLTTLAVATQTVAIEPAVTPATPQKVATGPVINSPQETNIWLWISVFLAAGWLITVVIFLTKRTVKKPVIENDDADISLKACIKNLKKACANNDALAAKDALLEWGRQKFNATNLGAIAGFCDARLRDEILHLNHALYGKEVGQWQGKKLFQTFTENKALERITTSVDKSLEPLYRL
ncbi:BatD family protein [Methylobacter sp. S3L5C]|uniref:BatD family protein n=1 Tax=Methylobacter sp. S3L5C TaxID=2839024 RepID=UPI00352E7C07